jgi:hypothetical protein
MNILKNIIDRLNQRLLVTNIFDQIYPLCELNANGNDKAWVHYIGNGQAEVVTNFDAHNGTIFWAKNGKVNMFKSENIKVKSCDVLYQTSYPLTAYVVVRKSNLPCDDAYSEDFIASQVINAISGFDVEFKEQMHLITYEVVPKSYNNEVKTLTSNYEYATLTIDFDVTFQITTNNPCFTYC